MKRFSDFIKEEIDLAVIAVPAPAVLEVINECCEKKVGGIILISAGFGEIGAVRHRIHPGQPALPPQY